MDSFSLARKKFEVRFPDTLKVPTRLSKGDTPEIVSAKNFRKDIKTLFPITSGQSLSRLGECEKSPSEKFRVGVVFSGGPASGGHNVIAGLYEGLVALDCLGEMVGFLNGPGGIIHNRTTVLSATHVADYKNTGGFDLLGSGRDKIESDEHLKMAANTVSKLELDALVVIGGDDSNTNAAVLAEYFASKDLKNRVLGVPKTIDGDLQNEYVEMTFGFHTATQVYAGQVSHIARDILSSRKYYHFVRLMGRAASHIAQEVALNIKPNKVLISEEIYENKSTLSQVVSDLVDLVEKRSKSGKEYGLVLIPEGIVEFMPDVQLLIAELSDAMSKYSEEFEAASEITKKISLVSTWLQAQSKELFLDLPKSVQEQLIADRDPHGNVQVSKIETEKLLGWMVETELKERKSASKFNFQPHFFGYEGRCAPPTNFDANYGYSLGRTAAHLLVQGCNGVMAVVASLQNPPEKWQPLGVPLTSMMALEKRHGKMKPVIKKALVETNRKAFQELKRQEAVWAVEDHYTVFAGPHYFGPSELVDLIPKILELR